MNLLRTSSSSPLIIAEIPVGPHPGYLGLTICPGKKDPTGQWDRDLATDIDAIQVWGATAVITLIEDHEFSFLQVSALGEMVRAAGMSWYQLPIVDVSIPDQCFEQSWQNIRDALHEQLNGGERILIHCRGGLGRTGLVAGMILVEHGLSVDDAIKQVRHARPYAIETHQQESYVRRTKVLSGYAQR